MRRTPPSTMGSGVPGFPVSRAAVAALTGQNKACLLKAYCYTDDPIMVTLRPATAVITSLVSGAAELLVDAAVD
jgi:hypothetical protein